MININITLSLPFSERMTDKELNVQLERIEHATDRLKAKYGMTIALSAPNVSSVNSDLMTRNRAYLAAHSLAKTPSFTGKEIELRPLFTDVDWNDIEARHKALASKGYNIFNPARNSPNALARSNEQTGETFAGDVDLDAVPE